MIDNWLSTELIDTTKIVISDIIKNLFNYDLNISYPNLEITLYYQLIVLIIMIINLIDNFDSI